MKCLAFYCDYYRSATPRIYFSKPDISIKGILQLRYEINYGEQT